MADLTSIWHYSRPALTRRLADRLAANERIAMFGPRQTGKTTLLEQELKPELETRGRLVVYVECWADRADTMGSINYALHKALEELRLQPGRNARRLARTPVRKLGLAGASIELGELAERGTPASPYLAFDSLLTQLREASGKDLVLIFDEFQAVGEAPDADQIAGAIRAAMTQQKDNVGAIFSGSSQVQLLQLFSRTRTPLYGFAQAELYPLLKEDFVAHVAALFAKATRRELNQAMMLLALEELGHQPQPFLAAASFAMSNPKWSIQHGVDAMLGARTDSPWLSNWNGLTDIQRVALQVVRQRLPPTAASTLANAAQVLAQARVPASSMARALEALLQKGLVSKTPEGKGYEVADPVMLAWLARHSG